MIFEKMTEKFPYNTNICDIWDISVTTSDKVCRGGGVGFLEEGYKGGGQFTASWMKG